MTRVIRAMQKPPTVSKSRFKAQALDYLRRVQATGRELVITDRGKPVLKVVPYALDANDLLRSLRGSVRRYDRPTDPVGPEDWESLR